MKKIHNSQAEEINTKMPMNNKRLKIFEAINGSTIHQSLNTASSQVTFSFHNFVMEMKWCSSPNFNAVGREN